MTKSVPAAEFEENVHALIDDVVEHGDEVLLMKDGRPVAKVVPVSRIEQRQRYLESMRGTASIIGDIVSPLEDEWDCMK